ncbi:MAG: Sec-independent protein translocase subunit TatA [Mycobacteriaceae bacterium]|nr:Sec-independent protein translocase subunit TatA [Mycobacteriaceae bacterium]
MGSLSPWHWAILAVLIVVLFGAKKLPDAARSLGKSMRIFKSEMRELHNENQSATAVTATPPAAVVQSERIDPAAAPGQGHSDAAPA